MSVKTELWTMSDREPSPSESPAAPRWTKASSRNWIERSEEKDTLAGAWVHDANGQMPPGTSWHSAWVASAPAPVSVKLAWISEKPSGLLGRSQVAYENWRPWNTMSWTGSSAVPAPVTSVSSAGATTSARRTSSPGRGR